ncbi:hypothetical protein T12_4050 [Trichinella patagoniensis]|uniref:PiggyBac transposable element-derived protein domain-containing protein n=1 Tax=Trichinella patagoniensis TaxID=990121 RepID=A0A0V1A1G6_9BILA|nr:hypothetical protein T12_4050 [Trichinella patagoniensis]
MISRLLRSGQRKTTATRKKHDKLAGIRKVDRRLFKEYMPRKAEGGAPERHADSNGFAKGLKGCNVTCDNFFTSYQLEVELRKRKLPVLGTIIKDKGVLPQELSVMCGRQRYLAIFAFSVEALLISYCPKKNKNVLLMSMMHKDLTVTSGSKKQAACKLYPSNRQQDKFYMYFLSKIYVRETHCFPLHELHHNYKDSEPH